MFARSRRNCPTATRQRDGTDRVQSRPVLRSWGPAGAILAASGQLILLQAPGCLECCNIAAPTGHKLSCQFRSALQARWIEDRGPQPLCQSVCRELILGPKAPLMDCWTKRSCVEQRLVGLRVGSCSQENHPAWEGRHEEAPCIVPLREQRDSAGCLADTAPPVLRATEPDEVRARFRALGSP